MSLRLGETVVAGSVDLTDYDTIKINTTSLGIQPSPGSGFSCEILSQVRIEHKNYYEYFVIIKMIGGTRSSSSQFPTCLVSGFVGTGLTTHTPIAMWLEGGYENPTGLMYSGLTADTTLSMYVGATSKTDPIRANVHLIRMK